MKPFKNQNFKINFFNKIQSKMGGKLCSNLICPKEPQIFPLEGYPKGKIQALQNLLKESNQFSERNQESLLKAYKIILDQ